MLTCRSPVATFSEVASAEAALSAAVVLVSADRTMKPSVVVWTSGSAIPAFDAAARTSEIVLPGTLDMEMTVPPLNSMPRFKPRKSSAATATTISTPETENRMLRRPMKLT